MASLRRTSGYGWRPDLPDQRDRRLDTPKGRLIRLGESGGWPTTDSLRAQMPPVYDQGQLGSCTANAIAGALEYQQVVQREPQTTPSRLFIYYGERQIEGTVDQDAGAEIRDGIKVVAQQGAPPEADWPYSDANPGPFQQAPSPAIYEEARAHEAIRYYRVAQDDWDLRWCIVHRFPVIFGFTVYESFESQQVASNGIVPMPAMGEQVVGGHAVLVVGFDHERQVVEVRNSWGPDWGDNGYAWFPYAYVTNPGLCSDFWTIRRTS